MIGARLLAAARGETGPSPALMAGPCDPRTGSRLSLHAAVAWRDRPRYHEDASASAEASDMMTLEGVCDTWAPLGPSPLVPQDTTVPVLVLAGEFDPNARPAQSRHVAEMMGRNVQWVQVTGMGHGVRAFSPCVSGLVSAFIDRPDRPLDTSCAAKAPAVRYWPNPSVE